MSIASEIQRLQGAKIDLAAAIEEKGVVVPSATTLDGYADLVEQIEQGGGGEFIDEQFNEPEVTFIDYDGTVLHQYTAQEFSLLSELPAAPSHTGLIAQGWNWTLPHAKAYVAKGARLTIGQNYTTSDTKTRLYIRMIAGEISELMFIQTEANGVEVDWGDGSSVESTSEVGEMAYFEHEYTSPGDYVISLHCIHGSFSFGDENPLFSPGIYVNRIELGDGISSVSFTSMTSLQTVSVPIGMTEVAEAAFTGCENLCSIVLPNGVTTIGNFAFSGDISIGSISLPKSIISVGNYAFAYCDSLKALTLPEGTTTVGESILDRNNLFSVTLPGSLTSFVSMSAEVGELRVGTLSSSIFNGIKGSVDGVKRLVILYGVTEIPDTLLPYVFEELRSVVLPDGITTIGESSFSGKEYLISINIPDSVTSIGDHAFESCTSLSSITLPNGITTIGESAFSWCSLRSVIIPGSVTSIGSGAFEMCPLESVIFLNGVGGISSLPDGMFASQHKLRSVVLPNSLTSIGRYAFMECASLRDIIIPEGVTVIDEGAFYVTGITSIILPENIYSISNSAFPECIRNIYCLALIPPDLDGYYEQAFVYVPEDAIDDYIQATGWMDYYIEGRLFPLPNNFVNPYENNQ